MTPIIELEHVSRRFQLGPETVEALRDVSLVIASGETVAVTGPSGSGKSTLMNILGLLDVPSEGRYAFAGRDVATASDDERTQLRNRRIGFVFQSAPMLPRLTAAENVAMPLVYRRMKPRVALAEARMQLTRVGLAGVADRRPHQLSGGYIQRVSLARALVGRPDVILADEPLAGLDATAAENMLSLLFELNRNEGVTLVLVTHERATAARCGRQIAFNEGVLLPAAEEAAMHG